MNFKIFSWQIEYFLYIVSCAISKIHYLDTVTGSRIVVGRHDDRLVMIPYEIEQDFITPLTIHATNRQQINLRIRTGRFTYE